MRLVKKAASVYTRSQAEYYSENMPIRCIVFIVEDGKLVEISFGLIAN
jgi:hypothetical protein